MLPKPHFGREVLDKEQADELAQIKISPAFGRVGLEGERCSRHSSLSAASSVKYNEQLKKLSVAQAGAGPTFEVLLQMLQQEHDRELDLMRCELKLKLEAMQEELANERRILQSESQKAISSLSNTQPATTQTDFDVEYPEKFGENVGRVNKKPSRFTFWRRKSKRSSERERSGETNHGITPTPWESDPRESHYAREQHNSHSLELETLRQFVSDNTVLPKLFSYTLTYDDSILPRWRQKLIEITTWQSFDIWCVLLILTNSIMIGVQIDYTSRHGLSPFDAPVAFRTIDRVYTCMFLVELAIRLLAFGMSFFYRHGWAWNLFDFIVVATDAVQTIVEFVMAQEGDAGAMGNFTALRMVRALRLTRAIRVIRLIRFFRELRMMVYSVMVCGKSLMWSLLMFFAIIYIFCFFLMNAVGLHMNQNKDDRYYGHYESYWTTLPQGMWTLFLCMSGGVSWNEVGGPLTHIGWVYGVTLGFFMFFTIFVVTNIITGIFVDTALRSAQNDRDEIIAEQLHDRDQARKELQTVFQQADLDCSGYVSYDEFATHLQDEKVRVHLQSIGLQVDEARALFVLLDIDQSGELGIEEFLFGCMRLKGQATSINLATLMYENKRMIDGFKKFHSDVITSLGVLHARLEQNWNDDRKLVTNILSGEGQVLL